MSTNSNNNNNSRRRRTNETENNDEVNNEQNNNQQTQFMAFLLNNMLSNQQGFSSLEDHDDINLMNTIRESMNNTRHGPPPAARLFVEELPDIEINERHLENACMICNENYKLGEEAKLMPCKHYYHHDCILKWLELHNTCPLCRHELPTLDLDYEEQKREKQNKSNKNPNQNLPDYMYM